MNFLIIILSVTLVNSLFLPKLKNDLIKDNGSLLWFLELTPIVTDDQCITVHVLGNLNNRSNDITGLFLKYFEVPMVLLTKPVPSKIPVTLLIIYVEHFHTFEDYMKKINRNVLWTPRTFIYLIPSFETNQSVLLSMAVTMWHFKIINFLIFTKSEAISYNRFTNSLLSFTKSEDLERHYRKKLENLYGYHFKSTIYNEFPKNYQASNSVWVGDDVRLFQHFAAIKNATVKIIGTSRSNYTSLLRRKSDFHINPVLLSKRDLRSTRISYPMRMDNLIALIPSQRTLYGYNHLFFISEAEMTFILFYFFFLGIVAKIFSNTDSWLNFCLQALRVFFGQSIVSMEKKETTLKIIYFSWIIIGLLSSVVFQSRLTSLLYKPQLTNTFNTISALAKSEMKIYLINSSASIIPKNLNLHKQFEIITHDELIHVFELDNNKNAIILLQSTLMFYLQYMWTSGLSFGYRPMRSTIVPGFTAYLFPNKSPYLEDFNKYFMRQFESGERGADRLVFQRLHNEMVRDRKELGYEDLKGVVNMLVLGLGLSTLVFVGEIIYYKYWDNIRTFFYRF